MNPVPTEVFPINGNQFISERYFHFHKKRVAMTLAELRKLGARKIIELGGHPWVMTSALIETPEFELCATISAEEVTNWSDDIGVTRRQYSLRTKNGKEAIFPNYSANIE